MNLRFLQILFLILLGLIQPVFAQDEISDAPIFDDKKMHDGYTEKFQNEPKETIVAMIKDDTLADAKMAAAVRVFKEKFSEETFAPEKNVIEKILIRRLDRTDSPLVEVEIMHTLCRLDRYKYFAPMVSALILKLDHYNATVNELAYKSINDIMEKGGNRPREARIVFNTLRKVLFLSRRKIKDVTEPDERLKQKLALLRLSMKALGTQEIRRLPPEVINLL